LNTEKEFKDALNKAATLCSRSEKCIYDIEKKLSDWDLMPDKIEEGIAYLVKEKFIDESRYAIHFVRDKFRFNHWGKIKIAYALRQKNISQNDISDAMNNITDIEYRQTLLEILKSKLKSVKGNNNYEIKAKLMRFAQSRGFETELINSVAEEVLKGE
jgi:regulatory protein